MEIRRTRSFDFHRVFPVISVPPWLIFIPMGGPQTHVTLGMTPQKTTYGDTRDCQTLQNGLQLRHEWTIDPGRRNSSRPWTATTSTASSSRIRRIYATCVVTPAATGCCCSSNDGPCSL